VTENNEQLESQVENAVKLHGHLGPFLVIGVRMGIAAKKFLKSENHNRNMKALVEVPLRTPFSCILDGIQSTTRCTIGNQKLRVRKSPRKIAARFETADSANALTVTVNPEIIREVRNQISKGAANESLAEKIASTPDNNLFKVEILKKHRQT
jgi:formylmethanofuran dehydrogenase subunit E